MKKIRYFGEFLADNLIVLLMWVFAFHLRFNFDVPKDFRAFMFEGLLIVFISQSIWFLSFYGRAGLWKYTSYPDLRRLTFSCVAATLVSYALIFIFKNELIVPRSVWIIFPLLSVSALVGVRVFVRSYYEWSGRLFLGSKKTSAKPVIVVGAGSAGLGLARELKKSTEWKIVGFLDDDPNKINRTLYDVKILGPLKDLDKVVKAKNVKHVIIAMPSAEAKERWRLMSFGQNVESLKFFTLPTLSDIVNGEISAQQIRELKVEDLLGRKPVKIENIAVDESVNSKVVLVTGAGGSIGSELCRQLTFFKPEKIIFFEESECALYELTEEFGSKFKDVEVISLMGDVKDSVRFDWVLKKYNPNLVFHAAAYKHVPLVELGNNWEAIRNNSWGSYNVARLCAQNNVDKFVLISTDKAVNPCNVMGASKRLAEALVKGVSDYGKSKTQFVTVRFGNVLGSRGSVIPKFRKQILEGGPVTVTHPDMERFFMSIPEAALLVLQAAAMGGEGEIFVLDMGKPVKLVHLAQNMIRLSGSAQENIKIEFTGIRPGEKMFEELFNNGENILPTHHEKIKIAKTENVEESKFNDMLNFVSEASYVDDFEVKNKLKSYISDYTFMDHKDLA